MGIEALVTSGATKYFSAHTDTDDTQIYFSLLCNLQVILLLLYLEKADVKLMRNGKSDLIRYLQLPMHNSVKNLRFTVFPI